MTLVGTVKAIMREIPNGVKENKNRAPGSKAFLVNNDMTSVSYLPNTATTKKNVFLLSSMHSQPTVVENCKREIIQFCMKPKEVLII